ncbi:hypothetical protein EAI_05680, partial [Harpegnathos saltator]
FRHGTMSFCRITGRSRGLPKPNYFPLLPPISPADAKRFCRITGKSYGLPTHHYIPVLLGANAHDKSKCKITNASGLGPHHYTAGLIVGEKKKHVVLKDYRYVFPILEGEGEQQRALRELLDMKQTPVEEERTKFVYTVEERRCSLVFPAKLEAAVRDGDVKDVMLSRDCDTVLLRLKQGKNVSVDFKNLEDFENLYDGLGPSEAVLKERERLEAETRKRKRKKQTALNYAKQVFEEKERVADEEELRLAKQLKLRTQLARNIALQQRQQDSDRTTLTNGIQTTTVGKGEDNHANNDEDNMESLRGAIKAAIVAAVLIISKNDRQVALDGNNESQDFVYSSISESFDALLRQEDHDTDRSVDEILRILLIPQNRSSLCQSVLSELLDTKNSKVDILRSTVTGQPLQKDAVLDRLSMVLEEEHGAELIGPAFRTVSKNDPELVSLVLENVSRHVADVATEKEAAEAVYKAIVQAVRESSEIRVKKLLNAEGQGVRDMLLQAVGLARALGMSEIASSLLAVISDERSTQALANDRVTMDVLKRLTIMRKLAEERPPFVNALGQLCSDPELARTDPRLRTLVRESAALMIVPEEMPLLSSADVPTALLHADNSLAMEEFLLKRNHKPSAIFMILKQGLQAVVPREASRSVLTGQVAYTVLDEDGIYHFEPLHVFSALRLNRPTAHRFSMYCCPVAKEVDIDGELMSTTFTATTSIASSLDGSANGSSNKQESNGTTLSRSEQSAVYSASRENTPNLKRLNIVPQGGTFERVTYETDIENNTSTVAVDILPRVH